MTLKITEIQRFCMHDGPGVRTTVFLKGCPLRCAWCHNPETQKRKGELLFASAKCIACGACAAACTRGAQSFAPVRQIDRESCLACFACTDACPTGALSVAGKDMTVKELLAAVARDAAFYGEEGGVTLSGGEPFLQGEGTLALLRACKERGYRTALETCGYGDSDLIVAAVPFVDLFLWDIKDTDEARHLAYTGGSLDVILSNLRAADKAGARIRLRCILVNGVNTEEEHYDRVAALALSLSRPTAVEILPYHAYGGSKATLLGKEDNGRTEWIPKEGQIRLAKERIRAHGVCVL